MEGHLPPVVRIPNFFGEAASQKLLEFALEHESQFKPATLRRHGTDVIDPASRVSKLLRGFNAFQDQIETRLSANLDHILTQLKIGNLTSWSLESEMVWNGEGSFFKRHIDTIFYANRPSSHRVVTMVYYFFQKPKSFTGGELRLYPLGVTPQHEVYEEVLPDYDLAVFFPSWFPHEVLPIHCPSQAFAAGRFSINCWVHKTLTPVET